MLMTDEEVTQRAQRAARWWNSAGKGTAGYVQWLKWFVTENNQSWCDGTTITDRMFIAFCEDRGWRDRVPTESEAVVWLMVHRRWVVEKDGSEWKRQDPLDAFNWIAFNPVEEARKEYRKWIKIEGFKKAMGLGDKANVKQAR